MRIRKKNEDYVLLPSKDNKNALEVDLQDLPAVLRLVQEYNRKNEPQVRPVNDRYIRISKCSETGLNTPCACCGERELPNILLEYFDSSPPHALEFYCAGCISALPDAIETFLERHTDNVLGDAL